MDEHMNDAGAFNGCMYTWYCGRCHHELWH